MISPPFCPAQQQDLVCSGELDIFPLFMSTEEIIKDLLRTEDTQKLVLEWLARDRNDKVHPPASNTNELAESQHGESKSSTGPRVSWSDTASQQCG